MRALLAAFFLMPILAIAAPSVLVDAIPTGAMFFNYATVKVPIADLEKADPKEVEAGLDSSIKSAMQFAEQNGVSYISVFSAAGENARSFMIKLANAKLRLQMKNPSFVIVLYREGGNTQGHLTYSLEIPDPHRCHVTMSIEKIAVPEG